MSAAAGPDFGTCPCGGRYENGSVEVRGTVGGEVVVLSDVARGTCATCAGRVYKADVLERIEAVLKPRR